jgi:thiamine-monophosphate kinase
VGAYWTVSVRGEFASLSAIRSFLPVPNSSEVSVWLGDDTAVVEPPAGRMLLLSADTVVAGVHADLGLTGLDDLGWKAMAASVSDIAAMGGDVGHALITVAGPPDTDLELLYEGVGAAAREFGCPVVGGDLTNAGVLVITVAVTGYSAGPPVTRAGARPGDGIWVTRSLGAAAAGLRLLRSGLGSRAVSARHPSAEEPISEAPVSEAPISEAIAAHARPRPQPAAGRAARRAGATAMIDVSDGLSADLDHVAVASGVGVRLESVPVHPAATLEEAMGGGEDYALVFCVAESAELERAFEGLESPIRIGRCTADPAERTLGGEPFRPAGWEHGFGVSGGRAAG